jgi:hypothetical protein
MSQGRILHTCFIFQRSPTSYLISHESPETHPTPLQTLLPPYKLRSKVRIKDVSEEWDTWASWGSEMEEGGLKPRRVWRPGSGGANESQWSWPEGVRSLGIGGAEIGCWDLRAGLGMRQLLIPKGQNRESYWGIKSTCSSCQLLWLAITMRSRRMIITYIGCFLDYLKGHQK